MLLMLLLAHLHFRSPHTHDFSQQNDILHMHKPVTALVFKVLRSGQPRYILYACPNL